MLERDGKLEEALVRGQQVQIGAQQLKKRSSQVNNKMKWRYYCYWIAIASASILALALFIYWIAK